MKDKPIPKPPGLEHIDADPLYLWELFTDRGGPDYEEPGWHFSGHASVIDAEAGTVRLALNWQEYESSVFTVDMEYRLKNGRIVRNWPHGMRRVK